MAEKLKKRQRPFYNQYLSVSKICKRSPTSILHDKTVFQRLHFSLAVPMYSDQFLNIDHPLYHLDYACLVTEKKKEK
jgi:hypothetical protein